MDEEQKSAIVSEDEIEAALAEAEQHAAEIPSLDDGLGNNGDDDDNAQVVHVPVEAEPVAEVSAPEDDKPTSEEHNDADTPAPQATARSTLDAILDATYQTIDLSLWILNWPFNRLQPSHKTLLAQIAIATIIVSILCYALLPVIAPPNDPISHLQRQAVTALEPKSPPPAEEESAAEE